MKIQIAVPKMNLILFLISLLSLYAVSLLEGDKFILFIAGISYLSLLFSFIFVKKDKKKKI